MAVSENYPTVRANQGFPDLQAQIEGPDNRITVARNPGCTRYVAALSIALMAAAFAWFTIMGGGTGILPLVPRVGSTRGGSSGRE
jgi:hypothetical protein